MLGHDVEHDAPDWSWSDQYAHTLQSRGGPGEADQVVLRGRVEEASFARFELRTGQVVSVLGVGRPSGSQAA